MVRGKNKTLLIYYENPILTYKNLIKFNCVIHMESLCCKNGTEKLKEIVTDVRKIINFIKVHALINREFNRLSTRINTRSNREFNLFFR